MTMHLRTPSILHMRRSGLASIRRVGVVTLAASLLSGVGCSSPDVSGPTGLDPTQAFWALTLSAHAITMSTTAPYDTVQLTVTPRTLTGAPLTGGGTPTFVTTDSSVRVSATGLLTARAVRSNVQVIAELTYQGVRLADTAVINVTAAANPPTFSHLALGPFTGDSTTLAMPSLLSFIYGASGTKVLQTEAQDASGTAIPEALVALRTSKPQEVVFDDNSGITTVVNAGSAQLDFDQVTSRPGPITVYADATVYGVTLQDSVQLTLTNPLLAIFRLTNQAVSGSPTPVVAIAPTFPAVIGVGGVIWWWNQSADSVDVVFDDPAAASDEGFIFSSGGGDIPAFPGGESLFDFTRARKFLQAGTFHFHSVRTGVTGTVIVQ